MTDPYEELVRRIQQAGYYASSPEHMGSWSRVTLCSLCVKGILQGSSFWVTKLSASWFVGAWGGNIYRIDSLDAAVAFTIDVFADNSKTPVWDFSESIKKKYSLTEVPETQFPDSRHE